MTSNRFHWLPAFTLIELVLVILLIGILSAVALPKFVNLGEDAALKANQKIFNDFARQLEQAHIVYSMKKGSNGELDWNQDGQTDLRFEFGYPFGARPAGGSTFYALETWSSQTDSLACTHVFHTLMKNTLKLQNVNWECYNAGVNVANCFKDPDVDVYVTGYRYPEAKIYQCYYLFSNSLIDKNPDFGNNPTIDGFSYLVANGLMMIGYSRGILDFMPGTMIGTGLFRHMPGQIEPLLIQGDDMNAVEVAYHANWPEEEQNE